MQHIVGCFPDPAKAASHPGHPQVEGAYGEASISLNKLLPEGYMDIREDGPQEPGEEPAMEPGDRASGQAGKRGASIVVKREGCQRCKQLVRKLRRMLEEDRGCRSTDCHIREFIKMATVLVRCFHPHESWLFQRIGDTATNVATDCAGDILCGGEYPFDEIRCFFARRCPVIASVPDDALIKTYKDFVEAKLHLTINAKRETEVDWARKIRGGIEQALWKHSRFESMEHRNRTFHYHRSLGEPHPMPEGSQEPDVLLADIRRLLKARGERKQRQRRNERAESESFHEIIEAIFISLANRDGCNHALTVSTLSIIVLRWYEVKLAAAFEETTEYEPDPIDDRVIEKIGKTIGFLREGRVAGLYHEGVLTRSECDSILNMVRVYLEDVLRQSTSGRPNISRLWREAFPERDIETGTKQERKRIADILRLARVHLRKQRRETGDPSPSAKKNEYTYMGTDVKPVKPEAFAFTDDAHKGQPKRNREEDSEMEFIR